MTTPRKVNWTNDEDFQTVILAQLGFSTKFIIEKVGFTPCQVSYRLHKAGVKRSDYRNGHSVVARSVHAAAQANQLPLVERKQLNKNTK